MNKIVWLIVPNDAIPSEKWGYKHGMFLADALIEKGFKVIYWTSSFSHAAKVQRAGAWEDRVISPLLTVRIVPCRSYIAHVGLKRVLSLFDFAWGVFKRGLNSESPNVLFVSLPNIFGDVFSVWLARKHKSALVTDLRDLWPEMFERTFPAWARPLAHVLFWPLYQMRAFALRNSNGFTAVCETYRQLAFKQAPVLRRLNTEVVYSTGVDLANFRAHMSDASGNSAVLKKASGEYWAIYAGTIGNNYDIETLLNASKRLSELAPSLKFVIAGDGPLRKTVESFIATNHSINIAYVGVLDMPTLCRYYAYSDIGLSIYAPNSTVAIPAKAFDYYAAGLPIVNSVTGEFAEFLRDNEIGFQYESGNSLSLCDALVDAISKPERLFKMKKRVSGLAADYDRSVQYGKYVRLIEMAAEEAERK